VSGFAPGLPSPGDTPLDVAWRNLAVSEKGGPNRGAMIDEWLRNVYLDPNKGPPGGYPWCAAAVSWWCEKGGRPIRKSASVWRLYDANHQLMVDDPQPGDICIRLEKGERGGKGHCGLYLGTEDGKVKTIEGNTNEAGSREGNAVAIKLRERAYWNMRFLRPRPA
jgi:hypothetical protein